MSSSPLATSWPATGCLVVGMGAMLFIVLTDPGRFAALRSYQRALDLDFERVLARRYGRLVVRSQLCLASFMLAGVLWSPVTLIGLPPIFWIPRLWQHHNRRRRLDEIEIQLDGWLTALASSLQAAPAMGDAIASTLSLVRGPLREELSLVMRQFQMGTALDDALAASARRVGSPSLSAVIATLRIARRTGGDLGATLEHNAATLREMARLEGVIRTKTAGGRAQATAIGVIPAAMIGLLHNTDPTFLAPIATTVEGHLIAGLACCMWLAAVFWARKIVAVEV